MKYLAMVLAFSITYIIFNIINYYQVKHIEPTIWSLTKYNFYLIPVYLLVNVILTLTFSKGFAILGKMWPVTIIYWGCGVIVTVALTFLFFKEIPKSNVLIGLVLTVVGIIVANYK